MGVKLSEAVLQSFVAFHGVSEICIAHSLFHVRQG